MSITGISNLYNPTRPAQIPEMFFGRNQELKDILAGILSVPPHSFYIIGERGIGKTSFLLQLQHTLKKSDLFQFVVPIYISFYGFEGANNFWEQLTAALIQSLDSVRFQHNIQFPEIDSESILSLVKRILTDLTQDHPQHRIIFLFDNIHRVFREENGESLKRQLAYLVGSNPQNVSFVFTGDSYGIWDIEERSSPLATLLEQVLLRPLCYQSAMSLVNQPSDNLFAGIPDYIWHQSGGRPLIIHFIMNDLIRTEAKGSIDYLVLIISKFHSHEHFRYCLSSLSLFERHLYNHFVFDKEVERSRAELNRMELLAVEDRFMQSCGLA